MAEEIEETEEDIREELAAAVVMYNSQIEHLQKMRDHFVEALRAPGVPTQDWCDKLDELVGKLDELVGNTDEVTKAQYDNMSDEAKGMVAELFERGQ